MTSRRGVCIARGCALVGCILGLAASARADAPKKESITIAGRRATVWASSTLASPKDPERYAAKDAFDGDIHTAWVEGAKGAGVGESLHVEFEHPVAVRGFAIWPGYLKSFTSLRENELPSYVDLKGGTKGELVLARMNLFYSLKSNAPSMGLDQVGPCNVLNDDAMNQGPRVVILAKPVSDADFQLNIVATQTHPGKRYEDAAISEWTLITDAAPWTSVTAYAEATRLLANLASGEQLKAADWAAKGARIDDVLHFDKKISKHSKTERISVAAIKKYLDAHRPTKSSGDALSDFFAATRDLWVWTPPKGGPTASASFSFSKLGSTYDLIGDPTTVESEDGPAAFWPAVYFDHDGHIVFAGVIFSLERGELCDSRLPAD